MYHADNGTFAGLCNKENTNIHSSIQPMIDALKAIAGNNYVRCLVRTSDVPSGGSHFVAADSLETKNFGVAVYFNERHYGVDATGVITLDVGDAVSGTQNFNDATNTCASLGKRLPSVEILKAINDYGAQGGNLTFRSSYYWSSTTSPTGLESYNQFFTSGIIFRNSITNGVYLRCAS